MTTPVGARGVRTWVGAVAEAAARNNLLVGLILLLGIVMLAIGPELFVADSWLTLVSGREIVEHGLPHHEALTTIALGRVWTDQQWLAHLIYFGLDRVGGLGLTVVFHTLMVTGALAITMVASRIRGASARMTLVAAIVCLFVAPWSWQLRAQSIALPLFAAVLGLVATDRGLAARRTYLVFPLLILWANVHGSMILGAALVSLAGFLALVTLLRRPSRSLLRRPLLYFVAPWACVIVSPYGTALVEYYRLLLIDSPVSKSIQEWKAPTPHGYLLVFFAVAVASVIVAIWHRSRLSLYDIAVLAVTLAGALRSGRGIIWFAMAAAMLLPIALDGIAGDAGDAAVHRRIAHGLTGTLAVLLAATAVYALARSDGWYEKSWPAPAAAAAARAANSSSTPAVVWPNDKYADWLLWKQPSLRGRLAWDVRFELLNAAEIDSIIVFKRQRPGWRQVVAPYRVLVLNRSESNRQARALARAPGTAVLFKDHALVVLSR